MSDQDPYRPGSGQQPPNWGNAYPPPPSYGPPPGYGQTYPPYTPPPPKHPQATASMVFGIVSIAGMFTCILPILVAPVAWILGAKAINEIDARPDAYTGRNEAQTGKILGIVGTCLLILAIAVIAILTVIAVNGGFDAGPDGYYDDSVLRTG